MPTTDKTSVATIVMELKDSGKIFAVVAEDREWRCVVIIKQGRSGMRFKF